MKLEKWISSMCIMVALTSLFIVIVVSVVAVSIKNKKTTEILNDSTHILHPSISPSYLRSSFSPSTSLPSSWEDFQISRSSQFVESLSQYFDMTDPVHQKTTDWITNIDTYKFEESTSEGRMLQRYILAYLYFATTQNNKTWLSCNINEKNEECDFAKIVSLNGTTPVEGFVKAYSWLSSRTECEWGGLSCNDRSDLTDIDLTGQQIDSTLPSEIALLSTMTSLRLASNYFHGSLPTEIGSMYRLRYLSLPENYISGKIPTEIGSMSNITLIDLSRNLFTGTIPNLFTKLQDLYGLILSNNLLTSTIPTEIGQLSEKFNIARLDSNFLEGTLPSEVGLQRNLRDLWIFGNELTGSLPSEIGLLSDLKDMRFGLNQFSGSIPDELYSLSQLNLCVLSENLLTGTISSKIGQMAELEGFFVRYNLLDGTVPSEIGRLSKLTMLYVNINSISGTMPNEVCNLESIVALQADCGVDKDIFGPSLISCACCTKCCSRKDVTC
jgi:hypothetical protein